MTSRRRSYLVAALCLSLLAALLGSVGPAAAMGPKGSTVAWYPCHRQIGFPFECAQVRVPLDYSNPGAGTIELALARLPASDPAHRIGSLFLNPGGPGGSGVSFVLGAAPVLYTPEVRARFDLVGWDPRGIARSTPLRCFASPADWGPYLHPFAFPYTARQEQVQQQGDLYLDDACARRGGPIMDHMATADVARDLDRLRAAVGDEGLTYAGFSYGSYLGVTYANLFPTHVRALVVDGVLDPIAWATGVDGEARTVPFSTRLLSAMGAMASLDEFFRLCDAAGDACAFAPHSADRFQHLADRLEHGPAIIQGLKFDYSALIANTLGAMYSSPSWPFLAQFLAFLQSRIRPKAAEALRALHDSLGSGRYPNDVEGFPGVACSDSQNPRTYQAWHDQGAISDERFGYFGRIWTWISSICARWPGADSASYLGPFTHRTSNPVLVVGNLFDPATRYQGAEKVHQLMPNSSLLTVHGWGHTSLFLSRCADRAVARYLLDVTTPPPGAICQQDHTPFESSGGRAELRARVVPALLPPSVGRALG